MIYVPNTELSDLLSYSVLIQLLQVQLLFCIPILQLKKLKLKLKKTKTKLMQIHIAG